MAASFFSAGKPTKAIKLNGGTMSKPDLPGDSHFRLEVWAETLDDSEIENCKLQIANCRNETLERLLSTCAPSGSRIQVSKSQCRSFLHFAFFNFQFAISNPPPNSSAAIFSR